MVHHNHWVLYVVNRIMKCIHIIDSNTYGNEMNYTRWQDFHQQSVNISGKALRFSKLMMNRLTTAIQRVRPNSGFPKFGNWDFRFDYEAPRMKCGSNDCGFFLIKYMQSFDGKRGLVGCVIDRVIPFLHSVCLVVFVLL